MPVTLNLSDERRLATITIDRPEKRNAMNRPMLEEFVQVLDLLDEVDELRVAMVEGVGPAFCAGRDLLDPDIGAVPPGVALRRWFNPIVRGLANMRVPTIAAVRGPALGAGFGIAFACDLVVVSETAVVGSPFARLGGILDCGGHHFLRERVGPALTRELVFTGRMLHGTEIQEVGLATRCVADTELDEAVAELASEIGAGPTRAFAHSKRILAHGVTLERTLELEADAAQDVSDSADVEEGLRAFAERRSPKFVGR